MFFRNFAIRMVYVDDHIWDFDLDAALNDISEQRRELVLRFRHELGRRQCVLAYLLLKRALREEYGIVGNPVFAYGAHGKPVLAGIEDGEGESSACGEEQWGRIHFNLSHCREAVACVISDQPVGIDVESVRPLSESLVSYTMSDEEQQAIYGADNPAVAFTRLWTMKEARMKLTGEGISNHIKEVLDDQSFSFETVVSENAKYVYTLCKKTSHR